MSNEFDRAVFVESVEIHLTQDRPQSGIELVLEGADSGRADVDGTVTGNGNLLTDEMDQVGVIRKNAEFSDSEIDVLEIANRHLSTGERCPELLGECLDQRNASDRNRGLERLCRNWIE